jgi:hypothetical protein
MVGQSDLRAVVHRVGASSLSERSPSLRKVRSPQERLLSGNLREATRLENGRNLRRKRNNTSGYIGVSWSKVAGKWHAYIKVSRKRIHLGLFTDILEAARAYDDAATEHFGEWAHLNFPRKAP